MQKSYHERGQSLVEVALVLPVLVILFVGIAEVGFFLFAHVQVANATRAGARHGSLCKMNANCDGGDGDYTKSSPNWPDLSTVVQGAVENEAPIIKVGLNTTVNVEPTLASAPQAGDPITVTVTYNHSPPFISIFVPMFPDGLPIEHEVVMEFSN